MLIGVKKLDNPSTIPYICNSITTINTMNKPLTPSQKRRLLRELIELKIHHGYEVSDYMGRALSWFNYEAVQSSIQEMNNNPI
tara:strand:+ start:255 stop:503 length:249 start_codon:yes stop_codon:yes gene_type:complete